MRAACTVVFLLKNSAQHTMCAVLETCHTVPYVLTTTIAGSLLQRELVTPMRDALVDLLAAWLAHAHHTLLAFLCVLHTAL
jgi:hypothetical protein